MSDQEKSEIAELKAELHALNEKLGKNSWATKNASWLITVAVLAIGGLSWLLELQGEVDLTRNDLGHHVAKSEHAGMSGTKTSIAEIRLTQLHITQSLARLEKELGEVKKGIMQ